MLVLSRRPKQSLMLGNNIEIHVLSVSGEMVKLGIKAPTSVQVLRGELYAQLAMANQSAGLAGVESLDLNRLMGKRDLSATTAPALGAPIP